MPSHSLIDLFLEKVQSFLPKTYPKLDAYYNYANNSVTVVLNNGRRYAVSWNVIEEMFTKPVDPMTKALTNMALVSNGNRPDDFGRYITSEGNHVCRCLAEAIVRMARGEE